MHPTNPIRVRRALAADREARARFYGGLSDDDIWYRFFVSSRHAAAERIERLIEGPPQGSLVAVAELITPTAVRIVGEAVVAPPENADAAGFEFAIVVASPHQGRGVGRRLATFAARESLALGIDTWEVVHLPDNPAIERIVDAVGTPLDRVDHLGVVRSWYRLHREPAPSLVAPGTRP